MKRESDGNTDYNWCTRNGLQRLSMGTERVKNRRTSRDHPNYNISQNSEKSPGELRRLAVTQSPVKVHQLTLE